ncbi:DUF4174 domain-containing protein [Vibrio sp.]|nr:DUF4174 domain-containing protein [Vibrio sp.]
MPFLTHCRRSIGISFIILFSMALSSQSFAFSSKQTELPFRSLYFFAPKYDQMVENFLVNSLKHSCHLQEREIEILVITQDGFTVPYWIKDEYNVKALFDAYGANKDHYTTILIDKNGYEKLRLDDQETNWQQISQTIDSNPVRQRKIRNGYSPCEM